MQGPSSKRSVGFSGAESISLNTVPVVPRTPQHDEVPRIMNGKKNVPPKVLISYNCLLVPVVVAFWWYWTRKTARKVVSRLFVTSGNETCHNDESNGFEYDEFSSWNEVTDQEQDTSVRLVRWIKRNDTSVRKRAEMNKTTRRTLRLNSSPKLSEPIFEGKEGCMPSASVGQWQFLQDFDVDGIELCVMPNTASDGSTIVSVTSIDGRLLS